MLRKWTIFLIGGIILLASCNRTEEVLVPDNTAPPDGTISDIVLESYINRTYITMLGRKPDDAEFATGISTLRSNNVSQQNRESFLNSVLSLNEFDQHLFNTGRGLYIDAIDTTEIRDQIILFDILLQDPNYQTVWDILQEERGRLQILLDCPADLQAGTIDEVEMHKRLVHNYIYDQINMGTQNFVISMFQNFLFRYPTNAELEASEKMVNGLPATVFLVSGRTKDDFIQLFFATTDYYEGQVRDVYSRFLFRQPDTEEMETHAIAYKNSGDYAALLLAVLSTNEFIGI